MADDKKLSSLKKKYGPLSGTGWVAVGIGTAAVYYIYKKIKGSSASSAALPSQVLSGGSTIPSTGSTTSSPGFASFSDWSTAAISYLTGSSGLSPTDAYNAVQNWINGVCLDPAQYSGLGGFIATQGVPPGYGSSTPPLTMCPTSSSSSTSTGSSGGSGTHSPTPSSTSVPAAVSSVVTSATGFIPGTQTGNNPSGITQTQQNTYENAFLAALNSGQSIAQAQLAGYAAEGVNPYPPGTAPKGYVPPAGG